MRLRLLRACPRPRTVLSSLLASLLVVSCGSSKVSEPDPDPVGIGPEGGTVTSTDGRAVLVIPAGALSAPTDIQVVATNGTIDPAALKGSFYEVRPTSTAFAIPAVLTIQYDPAARPVGTAATDLTLGVASGDLFTAIPNPVLLEQPVAARASVTTGGTFAVMWSGFTTGCTAAESRQFDFWVGEWNWSGPNTFPGTDDVTLAQGGCVLRELFVDTNGARARSISFFSPQTSQWQQTYVDNQGGRLLFTGGIVNGAMVMQFSSTERARWIPVDANTIRVEFQNTTDNGATWKNVGTGQFVRR